MKRFTLFLSLAAISVLGASEKPSEGGEEIPSNHVSYVSMASSLDVLDPENFDTTLVHFGVGSRLKGVHSLDAHSQFALNQTYIQTLAQISYLYSPKFLFGGYVGLGVKVGLAVGKHTFLIFNQLPHIDPIMSYVEGEENVGYFPETYAGPFLHTTWTKTYIADIPLILGFAFENQGKHHFIQTEINKDLKLTVTSGIGF